LADIDDTLPPRLSFWRKVAGEGLKTMADDPIGSYSPVSAVLPERDRRMPRQEKVYDPSTKKKHQEGGGDGHTGYDQGDTSPHANPHENINDEVSILNIPKDEMTKSVRDAINILLEEINFLKGELAKIRGHEAYLKEQMETDRLLQVLRRRALTGKIILAARRVAEESIPYSFIYITIKNAPAVGMEHGRSAYEEIMAQAAGALREGVEPGDMVGTLENHDFGIVLPGNNAADAEMKAQSLMLALAGRSMVWRGNTITIDADYGIGEIKAGDSIESVLERAVRNLNQTPK